MDWAGLALRPLRGGAEGNLGGVGGNTVRERRGVRGCCPQCWVREASGVPSGWWLLGYALTVAPLVLRPLESGLTSRGRLHS